MLQIQNPKDGMSVVLTKGGTNPGSLKNLVSFVLNMSLWMDSSICLYFICPFAKKSGLSFAGLHVTITFFMSIQAESMAEQKNP